MGSPPPTEQHFVSPRSVGTYEAQVAWYLELGRIGKLPAWPSVLIASTAADRSRGRGLWEWPAPDQAPGAELAEEDEAPADGSLQTSAGWLIDREAGS